MSGASSIEWTDATWNPVRGCSRVSEGCRNCYAERHAARFVIGPKGPGPFDGFAKGMHWTGRVELIPHQLDWPLRKRKPLRIFVNSMSDLFHEKLSNEAIAAVLGVMAACPQHTFQILTKRPERMREWFEKMKARPGMVPDAEVAGCILQLLRVWAPGTHPRSVMQAGRDVGPGHAPPWPLPNVWLGTSVEDQATADERIPHLLATPAAKRFVSYEPALGPVSFGTYLRRSSTHHVSMSVTGALRNRSFDCLCSDDGRELSRSEAEATLRDLLARGVEKIPSTNCDAFDEKAGCKGHPNPSLDWLIVGGESGPRARPFDVAWARSAVEKCKAAGVAVFVKQLGPTPFAGEEAAGHAYDFFGAGQRKFWAMDYRLLDGSLGVAHIRDRKGGDSNEWPEDLRVREFPS